MKTDLTKILTISGQGGLFLYLSQARTGAIVESIVDKKLLRTEQQDDGSGRHFNIY